MSLDVPDHFCLRCGWLGGGMGWMCGLVVGVFFFLFCFGVVVVDFSEVVSWGDPPEFCGDFSFTS
nr:hypothetical protein [Arcanobacterium phocae]